MRRHGHVGRSIKHTYLGAVIGIKVSNRQDLLRLIASDASSVRWCVAAAIVYMDMKPWEAYRAVVRLGKIYGTYPAPYPRRFMGAREPA